MHDGRVNKGKRGDASARARGTDFQEGSQTTTTSLTSLIPRNVSRLQVAIGRPRSSRYCLGMLA